MINFQESIYDVYLSFKFDVNRSSKITKKLAEYINYLKVIGKIKYAIYENDDFSEDIHTNIEDALDYITSNLSSQANSDTHYEIKMSLEKENPTKLLFYSYESFSKALDSELKSALKEVDLFSQKYETLYLYKEKVDLDLRLNTTHKYDSENIFHRYNFDIKPKITPEHLHQWGIRLDECDENNIFHSLCVYMTLIVFSNKSKYEDGIYNFFFEGPTTIALKVDFLNDTRKIKNEVHDLFNWVFEDTGSIAKISILRNIITINGFTQLEQAFSQETIYAIESNHRIYQEDNIKQYFDVKNKVVDFIFGLSNKMSDSYDHYYQSNKVNLIAIMSYIVTLLVIRGMSKATFESSLVLFSLISLAFFIVTLIYTYLVDGELKKKVSFYTKQKEELELRYRGMLCAAELSSLFDSPSFNDITHKSEEAKIHFVIIAILIALIIAIVIFLGINLSIPIN